MNNQLRRLRPEYGLLALVVIAFLLGGSGWEADHLPANVRYIGHVPTSEHRAWNCSARLVLNINRTDMAATGFSPPTRVFEAAGCGSCVVTVHIEGDARGATDAAGHRRNDRHEAS